MLTLINTDQDIRQFCIRLSASLLIVFITELLTLNFLAILFSIACHGYLLFFCFNLSKEFSSLYPLHILVAVTLTFLAELALPFNPEYSLASNAFWIFTACHFLKNIVLSGRFMLNIYRSHIHNEFWTKILPYPCVGMLFVLLEVFIYGKSTKDFLTFLVYNAVACFTLLTAALRYNHTSYRGFYVMTLGIMALIISDIFVFTKALDNPDMGTIWGFRATFLILGNMCVLLATYDHVLEFEKEMRGKIYFGAAEDISPKARALVRKPTAKTLEEPLV